MQDNNDKLSTQTTDQERARALMRRNAGSPVEALITLAVTEERERCAAIVHELSKPYLQFPDREVWELGQKILEAIENVD